MIGSYILSWWRTLSISHLDCGEDGCGLFLAFTEHWDAGMGARNMAPNTILQILGLAFNQRSKDSGFCLYLFLSEKKAWCFVEVQEKGTLNRGTFDTQSPAPCTHTSPAPWWILLDRIKKTKVKKGRTNTQNKQYICEGGKVENHLLYSSTAIGKCNDVWFDQLHFPHMLFINHSLMYCLGWWGTPKMCHNLSQFWIKKYHLHFFATFINGAFKKIYCGKIYM